MNVIFSFIFRAIIIIYQNVISPLCHQDAGIHLHVRRMG